MRVGGCSYYGGGRADRPCRGGEW
uniref:Uncharacterized protein n=1 Tax=Arundo donax TaxID=35708 RepID=A0A0A9BAH9_ARUDO